MAVYVVRGQLLDSETMQGLVGVVYGVRVLNDGELLAGRRPISLNTGIQGVFACRAAGALFNPCSPARPELTQPDQVEVIVVRDDCEQRFLIDLDQEAEITTEKATRIVIDLKDPILVSPCEE